MGHIPIPEGRAQCEAQVVKRDRGKRVHDRRGAVLRVRCGHVARRGEAFCGVHADPSYRERTDREARERYARVQERRRNRWTVARLARLKEDRQLDLFVWGDAHDQAWSAAYRREIDAMLDEPDLVLPATGDDRGWTRYLQEADRRRARDEGRFSRVAAAARAAAEAAALAHGMPSWPMLRALIYERDKSICFVCGDVVKWEHFHLGHLQDRMMGGSDHPNNLVVMCNACNLYHKPLHETPEDAREWAAATRAYHERMRAQTRAHPMDWQELSREWEALPEE